MPFCRNQDCLEKLNPIYPRVKRALSILLSLCLGSFLACGAISACDDSLALLFNLHILTAISALLSFFGILTALAVYVLMGLTPMIPKRVFLPVTLFYLAGALIVNPILIFSDDWFYRGLQLDWAISLCQVLLGLGVLWALRGGMNFRWPLVEEKHLGDRRFSWLNFSVFLPATVVLLVPFMLVYVYVCAALAISHFTGGFMALHPRGLTVQVRKYVRDDGKKIELVPMAHIGDAGFYQKVARSFPTNSVVLMEGVTDNLHLLTNGISYQRAAHSLGLVEQQKAFKPRGEVVSADIDVSEFTTNTIGLLNLVMLVHAKGVTADTLGPLLSYRMPPGFEKELFGDIVKKRNQHLLEQIGQWIPQSDDLIIPWGAGHMPGIAKGIQQAGFRLAGTEEYTVIGFSRNKNGGG